MSLKKYIYNACSSSWNTFLVLQSSAEGRHPENVLLGNNCQPQAMGGNGSDINTVTTGSSQNPPASIGDPGDVGSIPGSGRAPGGGNGHPSCILAWKTPWTEEFRSRVHGVTELDLIEQLSTAEIVKL